MKRHITRVHNIMRFKCDFDNCSKKFKNEFNLELHKTIHFNDNKYVCNEMNSDYKTITSSQLETNKQFKHSDEKSFKCNSNGCNKSYKHLSSLKQHKSYAHNRTQRVQHKCPIESCNKFYLKKSNLNTHLIKHSDKWFACEWPGCDFKSKDFGNLTRHRKRVHICERNFVCDWPECGKRFKCNFDLSQHNRIHTNDKQHACHWPGCPFRTTSTWTLKNHINRHIKHNKL